MKGQNFGLLYFLLVIGQVILCNFANFGPYVMLTMLPAMIICVPLSISTISCMLIAFATGLSVDFLAEGLIGINAAALVPVALMRKPLIRFFLGEDIISRNDSFSIRKNGVVKISVIMLIATTIFLAIYIYLDGAGIRPTWFLLARAGISVLCCYPLALIVTRTLTPDDRK
ncbi:MAG: hypothetical protein IJ005_04790 [Bacteroidales bacterium]|nr:hypothetical protein [Bacteroidales bacterium]